MITLKNTIKVIVPTMDNDGKAIDYMAMIQEATDVIGGSTMYDAKGLWIDNDTLYKDKSKMVEFNTTDKDTDLDAVLHLVSHIFVQGQQLAAWLQVNGTTYLIDMNDNLRDVRDTIENESMVK